MSERRDDVGLWTSAATRDEHLLDEALLQAIDTISDSIEPHLERWGRGLDDVEASLASPPSARLNRIEAQQEIIIRLLERDRRD